ncbi:MAG: prenyltransferase/squalene oxidase repeat-containing protein [Desulfobacteraceae bacterium]|jgi:hypothetical protein
MYHDIIRSILNSDLNQREKLDKIEEIVDRVERIERLALEYASEEGRNPTWDDRLMAIEVFEEEEDIVTIDIDQTRLEDLLASGIEWLKQILKKNNAWDTGKGFQPFVCSTKPDYAERPLEMLYLAPWEISMTIFAFQDWVKHFSPNDDEALGLIEKGRAYLREVQRFFKNGGLGDSIWFRGMRSSTRTPATNALETAMSISAWSYMTDPGRSDYSDAVEEAVTYLERTWNKKDGGWGFKKGWKSDVKSTSLALMTLAGQADRAKGDKRFGAMLDRALEWLLVNQNPEDGTWARDKRSKDNALFGSYFAIEALTMESYFLTVLRDERKKKHLRKYKERIDLALSRALRWYEASQQYMKGTDFEGWGWQDEIEGSDVENTAAGIIVLLDAGWLDESSSLMENTLYWLFRQKDPDQFWRAETPLVLMSFIRFLKHEARLFKALERLVGSTRTELSANLSELFK